MIKGNFWFYVIAVVASLGGLLAGFDMGVISGALFFINTTWEMSPLTQGWLVSAAIVGSIIGAGTNGILSDIYGRKKIIIATALIFALGSVLCFYATSIHWLIAARVVVGIAVGMVTFVVPLYLSELAPQKIRGVLVSLFQLALTVGILFAYLINRVFANFEYNWRWMLGSGLFPAIILFIGICFLSDTPRWLISKNKDQEAKNIFNKLNPKANAEQQIKEIRATLQNKETSSSLQFQKWMLMPVFVGVGIMFVQICTGINTIIYYTATIFNIAGFSSQIGAIYATIGIGFVNFSMTIVAIVLIDRWGRKPLLYSGLWGMFISLLSLGLAFKYSNLLGDNLKWVAVSSVVVYIASFAFSLGPVAWILASEILPLKIRGFAMSLCAAANFSFNFVVVLTFLPLINAIGEANTFWIFSLITLASMGFVYYFVPETKDKSLELIEDNWRQGIPARKF